MANLILVQSLNLEAEANGRSTKCQKAHCKAFLVHQFFCFHLLCHSLLIFLFFFQTLLSVFMVSVRVTSWNRHNQSPKKKKEQGLRLKIKHKRLQCDYNSNNYNITSSACIAIVIVNIVMHNKSQRKKRQTTEEDQLLIIRANFGSIKNTTMTFCACCLIVALTSTKEGEKRDILKAKCLLACLKSGVVRGRERL